MNFVAVWQPRLLRRGCFIYAAVRQDAGNSCDARNWEENLQPVNLLAGWVELRFMV